MKRQKRAIWIAAVLALALISGGLWRLLFHERHLSINPFNPNGLPGDVEMRLNHVVFRGISNGKIVWELDAEHIDLTKDQQSFTVSGVKKMALIKDGNQELTVSAEGLTQNISTGDINIFGHVSVMGKDLTMYTPGAYWNDRMQTFLIPKMLSAQLGDVTVVAEKGARYSVKDSMLRCEGKITVGYGGNTLTAGGIEMNGVSQQLTLTKPVHAKLIVADVQQWAAGRNLPKIPDVPEQVKAEYKEFCKRRGYR